MRNFKNLLFVALLFVTATVLGQTKITGTVVDDTNQPLPGASIVVKGTANGTSTDFDGKFTLTAKTKSGVVVVSFIGYKTREFAFSSSKSNFKSIKLEEDAGALDEIVVTATSFAIGRKTPVAVSTIKAADIEAKLGAQEFPEILKSTPGVYATKSGGGYGDGRINLRGFRSQNVAVMINGIPVNDMENGAVYWSNWAGLSDVTSAMQVQRGLGASKVAVPSIGGTINVISKSTDAEKGGIVRMSTGNNGYQKYGMTLSTGMMDNGFAVTASAAKVSGEGYVDGLQFSGVNYFLNVSKEINEKHKLSFNVIGTIQEHGQRYNRRTIAEYRATEQGGKRFNPDWGYRNGQVENTSFNFYHKPQISLNYDWIISEETFLTTSVYASFGTGGGRRTQGSKFISNDYRLGGADQPIDFDRIVDENISNGALGATDFFAASKNSHEWYGVLSTLKTKLSETLSLSVGIDARSYVGSHWYEVTDLLGGEYFYNDDSSDNTGGQALQVGDRFSKDYDGIVKRYGVFGQLEYSVDDLSVFFSTAISNTAYSKEDFMKYAANDPERKSDVANFLGYSTKGGANYNIDDQQNVFANVGYFSKAPFLTGNVFQSDRSTALNEDAINEKVFSAEVGYGFKSQVFSANLNIYTTSWLDKSLIRSLPGPGGENLTVNINGLDALHQGVEFDFLLRPMDKLAITGMASVGNWKWKNDAVGRTFAQDGTEIASSTVYAKGLKVSDAAQTTFALGAKYDLLEKTTISLDFNYAGDNYAYFDVNRRNDPTNTSNPWKLPSYSLFDLGLRHGFTIGDFDTTLTAKMNNLFDVEYISDANDGDGSTYDTAQVYYGAGRTFSLGLKVKF